MKYSLLPVLLISTALKYDSAKVQTFDSIVNFSTPKTINKFITDLAQLPLEQQSEEASAQDSEAKRVQQDVVKIIQAMFNDNLDILLNYRKIKCDRCKKNLRHIGLGELCRRSNNYFLAIGLKSDRFFLIGK